jgi:hypothetical protein
MKDNQILEMLCRHKFKKLAEVFVGINNVSNSANKLEGALADSFEIFLKELAKLQESMDPPNENRRKALDSFVLNYGKNMHDTVSGYEYNLLTLECEFTREVKRLEQKYYRRTEMEARVFRAEQLILNRLCVAENHVDKLEVGLGVVMEKFGFGREDYAKKPVAGQVQDSGVIKK